MSPQPQLLGSPFVIECNGKTVYIAYHETYMLCDVFVRKMTPFRHQHWNPEHIVYVLRTTKVGMPHQVQQHSFGQPQPRDGYNSPPGYGFGSPPGVQFAAVRGPSWQDRLIKWIFAAAFAPDHGVESTTIIPNVGEGVRVCRSSHLIALH